MSRYRLTHLSDAALLHALRALVVRDRNTTAKLLAHIAEVDARGLFAKAGCSSMFTYCVERLGLSEDAAYKRIQAARAARRFPVLFTALAQGRLTLTAIRLLAPYLTPENVDELLAAISGRRTPGIERLLAERFPPSGPPATVPVIRAIRSNPLRKLAVRQVGGAGFGLFEAPSNAERDSHPKPNPTGVNRAPAGAAQPGRSIASGEAGPRTPSPPPAGSPALSVPRFLLRLEMDQHTHDKFRYAQQLLAHTVPSGDPGKVLSRALDALIEKLEKRKLGATTDPSPKSSRSSARSTSKSRVRSANRSATRSPRHIPAAVRRAVWKRDGGRCTFVNQTGKRCNERKLLEFDHRIPVARGGKTSVEAIRLLCRTHNQHEAERHFGRTFMQRKRSAPRRPPG